ncbi:cartilage-associated protein-like [Paramacrobiotus metropolitanus]|uniref:cartilage-associated protein-like n=1 Tax=Paramacrobiotus metropolitanus TaxID=2943436 RepID=UPI0024461405|nr:cartilage-associated protein-like [Paramacrobiotus metropolitanus]
MYCCTFPTSVVWACAGLLLCWAVSADTSASDVSPAENPSPAKPTFTYIQYYESGIVSYNQEKWLACIAYFNEAVKQYKIYKDKTISCRRICNEIQSDREAVTTANDTENRFLEIAISKTLCLLRCRKSELGGVQLPYAPQVDEAIEDLMPYHYMQFCYFNAGMKDKALAAAYTFLHAHPGHEVMQHNINFYMEQLTEKGADTTRENLESRTYQEEFLKGIEAHDSKDHQGVVEHMEKALEAYLEAEADCRAMCEGPFDQDGMLSDKYIALANHMTYSLKCRRRCSVRLQHFDGYGSHPGNFVVRCYVYLAQSYEKLEKLTEACQAVASVLLLDPNNEAMGRLHSDLFGLSSVHADNFMPRSEATHYYRHDNTDMKMLQMIDNEFANFFREIQNMPGKQSTATDTSPATDAATSPLKSSIVVAASDVDKSANSGDLDKNTVDIEKNPIDAQKS